MQLSGHNPTAAVLSLSPLDPSVGMAQPVASDEPVWVKDDDEDLDELVDLNHDKEAESTARQIDLQVAPGRRWEAAQPRVIVPGVHARRCSFVCWSSACCSRSSASSRSRGGSMVLSSYGRAMTLTGR